MAGRDAASKRRRTDAKDAGGDDKAAAKKPLNGYQGRKYDPLKAQGIRNNDRLDERDLKRRKPSSSKSKKPPPAKGKKRTQRK